MSITPKDDRRYFAAFLDLRDKPGVVVGGGAVAAQKAETLLRSGVRVKAVAPEVGARLSELTLLGAVRHEAKRFQPGDLIGAEIAVAATNDPAVNAAVAEAARALRIPVNVADDAARSSFIMPAVIDRAPLQIAISSGGASPVLARKLRALLEAAVPAAYGRLAALAARFRAAAKERIADATARRRFWEDVFDGPVGELQLQGKELQAEEKLRNSLENAKPISSGMVSLVGAGPGNPDLLTLRALRALQRADVVLYDHLVAPEILDFARREAERVYVGKEQDNHAIGQGEINALMLRLAREGKRVVRLKGGDPFIFGRGGEEIESLAAQGVTVEVIPGITAASGAAAAAGIPLTHRDCAQACLFATGHLKDGAAQLDWEALARPRQTLVIYMGLHGLAQICDGLARHGLGADTPAALIENATLPGQRIVEGTLADLPRRAVREKVRPPAMLIVGEVVRLRARMAAAAPSGAQKALGVVAHGERGDPVVDRDRH